MLDTRPLLLLQNFLAASHNLHDALSSRCSLLASINILEHPVASFSPSVKFKTRHYYLLRLKLRSLRFLKGALLPNFNNMVEVGLLIMGVQQLEDTFGIVRTKLRFWRDVVDLGATDLSRGILLRILLSKTFSLVLREFYCLNAVLFLVSTSWNLQKSKFIKGH